MNRDIAISTVCCAPALLLAALCAPAAASVLDYDPTLGTLPQSQGWTYAGNVASPPVSAVTGGTLTYGPTSNANTLYWSTPTAMNFTSDTWSIEATVQLLGTSFSTNGAGFRRGGFTLGLIDSTGNWIIAEVGSTSMSIRNDNFGNTDPSTTFDLSTAAHIVRLEAGPAGGRLYIDNVLTLSLPLGTGSAGSVAWWGESSALASTQSSIVSGVSLVPTPGSAVLIALAGTFTSRRRSREV